MCNVILCITDHNVCRQRRTWNTAADAAQRKPNGKCKLKAQTYRDTKLTNATTSNTHKNLRSTGSLQQHLQQHITTWLKSCMEHVEWSAKGCVDQAASLVPHQEKTHTFTTVVHHVMPLYQLRGNAVRAAACCPDAAQQVMHSRAPVIQLKAL
jgi:hypothetical protein